MCIIKLHSYIIWFDIWYLCNLIYKKKKSNEKKLKIQKLYGSKLYKLKIIWVEIIWIEIIWNAIIWVEIIWNVTEPVIGIVKH